MPRFSTFGITDAFPTENSRRPFVLRSGDTSPAIVRLLKDAFSNSIDLTNAGVRFHMAQADDLSQVIIDQPATVLDAVTGRVAYEWQDGDTDTAGEFVVEWEIRYNDGTIETVPKVILDEVNILVGLA